MYTRYPVSVCFKPEKSSREKLTKINLRITAKRHAHLQTLKKKTPAKFQKDLVRTVGAVAFTRLDTIYDGQTDARTGKTICLLTLTGGGGGGI